MASNTKGFSTLEGLLIALLITVVGGAVWLVWQRQDNKSSDSTDTTQQTAKATEYTDCHTNPTATSKATANSLDKYEWNTIKHINISLSDWKVNLKLPASSVDKAVCRYTGDGYEFSTLAIINDDTCVAYYRNQELTSEGIKIAKYASNTPAEGQINGASGTLDSYYQAHKSTSGNFFTEATSGRNYYKVGDNFYVAFGDTKLNYENVKNNRTSSCKNEKPDYMNVFVDAMGALKQAN